MIKKILFIIGLIIFSTSNMCAYASELRFFIAAQDVPLMQGLYEIEEQSLVFDKAEGRISESFAYMGDLSKLSVSSFYSTALPQFGWNKVGANRFTRKNELLYISFYKAADNNIVKIMIMPSL